MPAIPRRGAREVTLHRLLDFEYGSEENKVLRRMLDGGADPNEREGPLSETPLMVATRRRRLEAVAILLDRGAVGGLRSSLSE